MMDDSAPTHKRRKLVTTYKHMCSLYGKQTVVAGVWEETYSKNVIKWRRKTATDVINPAK